MNDPVQPSILIVDDNENFRERLGIAFSDRGWLPFLARNGQEALVLLAKESPEYVLLDLKMPGPSGLEVLGQILAKEPETQVVILTGYGSIATAIEAVRMGAKNYLTKPSDIDEILKAFGTLHDLNPSEAAMDTPSLARTEWEHIQRVLQDCQGNISEAARRLKIHRRSLQRKLQKRPPKK